MSFTGQLLDAATSTSTSIYLRYNIMKYYKVFNMDTNTDSLFKPQPKNGNNSTMRPPIKVWRQDPERCWHALPNRGRDYYVLYKFYTSPINEKLLQDTDAKERRATMPQVLTPKSRAASVIYNHG
jgi:hypothetical protein